MLLFDWTSGGHHRVYLRRTAEALATTTDVVVAAPDEDGPELDDLPARFMGLGPARPREDHSRDLRPQFAELAQRELALLERAIDDAGAGLALHMYADPVLRHMIRRPAFPVPVSLLMFFPYWHYGGAFGSHLSRRERLKAGVREAVVALWRRRPDAGTVLTLDPYAARRWAGRRGAPAAWFPEPPVATAGIAPTPARRGAVVFGALSRHKGLPLLADAVAARAQGLRITLAGNVDPTFADELETAVARMREAGAEVEERLWRHTEPEALSLLASAGCVVLPYPRHIGMSRVLVESAAVGRPVVVNDFGLLGHLVRVGRLGEAVDCACPYDLNRALRAVSSAGNDVHHPALTSFSEHFRSGSFAERLRHALVAPT